MCLNCCVWKLHLSLTPLSPHRDIISGRLAWHWQPWHWPDDAFRDTHTGGDVINGTAPLLLSPSVFAPFFLQSSSVFFLLFMSSGRQWWVILGKIWDAWWDWRRCKLNFWSVTFKTSLGWLTVYIKVVTGVLEINDEKNNILMQLQFI